MPKYVFLFDELSNRGAFYDKLIMQKAVNRFWDWMFHPSVRKYVHPQGKAISYRYPSPGNAKLQSMLPQKQTDYKTPYAHSHYNVRYQNPTQMQMKDTVQVVQATAFNSDPIHRLKKTGLLKRGEEGDADKVAAAKAKFQQKFSYSADQTVYKNDDNYNLLRSNNREQMQAYIQSYFQEVRYAKEQSYDYCDIKSTIHDPEIVPLESLDMFTAPHFQQGRVSNEQLIELSIDEVTRKKQIDTYTGDARFWKAIDDAYDKSEILKVQKHVGDQDPLAFELRPARVELQFDNEGKVVDLHQKQ